MIDLVKTHLTHPWGPPWTLETLGGPWRPLATCLKMTNFPQNGHFQACRQGSPMVAKGRQGFPRTKGDPRNGLDELKPDRSYLSHFPPWYSKSGQFPIKNEKWPLGLSYGSIILKIVLWPYFTITHAVLTESRDWKLLPSPPLHQGGGLIIICSA